MASVSDVFKEIQHVNGRLDTVHSDLQQLSNDLQMLRGTTDTGFSNTVKTLNAGFSALAQGMEAIIKLQAFANDVLLHHTKQFDTMICTLEYISNNTCNLITESHIQTTLQKIIAGKIAFQTEILKSTHAEVTVQLERDEVLRQQIEACCPTEQEPPACVYRPCEASQFKGEVPRIEVPQFKPVVQKPAPIR